MFSGRLRPREKILGCNMSFVVEEKEDGCIGEGTLEDVPYLLNLLCVV